MILEYCPDSEFRVDNSGYERDANTYCLSVAVARYRLNEEQLQNIWSTQCVSKHSTAAAGAAGAFHTFI